jgi:hypothetical protein
LKFNPVHQFTCSWREGVDTKFLPKYKQKISDKRYIKKVSQKKVSHKNKKRAKKNGTTTKHPQMIASK